MTYEQAEELFDAICDLDCNAFYAGLTQGQPNTDRESIHNAKQAEYTTWGKCKRLLTEFTGHEVGYSCQVPEVEH